MFLSGKKNTSDTAWLYRCVMSQRQSSEVPCFLVGELNQVSCLAPFSVIGIRKGDKRRGQTPAKFLDTVGSGPYFPSPM